LQAGLTQAVSLIQGPPGTGKTFLALQLMRVLLAARRAGDPPILVMCLTNHALDQFLEGLVAMGEREIVRVGSRWARTRQATWQRLRARTGAGRGRGRAWRWAGAGIWR
jgi:Rad3-related DNA helicase